MATDPATGALLAGVRIIESSLLGPGAVGMHLADLRAGVNRVTTPGGALVRRRASPIIAGVPPLPGHLTGGRRSIALDRKPRGGGATSLDLARRAAAVMGGMGRGALNRRGRGYDRL